MKSIIIEGKEFKQVAINKTYFISSDGLVYSSFSKRLLKLMKRSYDNKKYYYVDIFVGGKQKHITIHRLVYETWVGSISPNMQVNHKNDNSLDNRVENLYIGTQSDNIRDCIYNGHRVGSTKLFIVYDRHVDKTLTFCPANDFISYCGHTSKNGSIKRFFTKNWFKKRYIIIEFRSIVDLNELKSVTTIADECRQVGWGLSPLEAHSNPSD